MPLTSPPRSAAIFSAPARCSLSTPRVIIRPFACASAPSPHRRGAASLQCIDVDAGVSASPWGQGRRARRVSELAGERPRVDFNCASRSFSAWRRVSMAGALAQRRVKYCGSVLGSTGSARPSAAAAPARWRRAPCAGRARPVGRRRRQAVASAASMCCGAWSTGDGERIAANRCKSLQIARVRSVAIPRHTDGVSAARVAWNRQHLLRRATCTDAPPRRRTAQRRNARAPSRHGGRSGTGGAYGQKGDDPTTRWRRPSPVR